jgi:16S rRNA (guanine(966)-N(2))-methyltransferase RsmD
VIITQQVALLQAFFGKNLCACSHNFHSEPKPKNFLLCTMVGPSISQVSSFAAAQDDTSGIWNSQKPVAKNTPAMYISAMRIIAGSKRGMKLLGPKTQLSRPITDRVKESLFSVLGKYNLPGGAVVADLFCGVGSLGLEALSRDAEFVTFVEKDPKIVATLNRNIEKAGFAGKSKVIKANAFKIGAAVCSGKEKEEYGLVFLDPPYSATGNVQADSPLGGLLESLAEQVSASGIVVVRTGQDVSLLGQYVQFRVAERRQWGTMAVTILVKSRM